MYLSARFPEQKVCKICKHNDCHDQENIPILCKIKQSGTNQTLRNNKGSLTCNRVQHGMSLHTHYNSNRSP